jgi:acylglycerol lipase
VVVFLHDYGSYSGEVAQVLPHFLSRGLAVVSYDVRGHGRSSGIHGLLPSLSALGEDLQLVLDMVATLDVSRYSAHVGANRPNTMEPPPLFLFGNGLGGLQALFYAATLGQDSDLKGIVVQSPLLSLDQPYAHYERSSVGLFGNILGFLFPAWPFGEWLGNQSTLTQEQMDKLQSDMMRYHGKLRAGTAKRLTEGIGELTSKLHRVTIPVFLQQGASDISKLLHSEAILRGISSEDKQLVTYKTSSNLFFLESPLLLSSITEEALDWVDATSGQRNQVRRFVNPASPFEQKPRRRRRRIKDRMLRAKQPRDRLPSLEPDGAITMTPSEENPAAGGNGRRRSRGMYRRIRGMWGSKSSLEPPTPINEEDFISDGDNSGEDETPFQNRNPDFSNEPPGLVVDGDAAEDVSSAGEAFDPRFAVNDEYRNELPPVEEWPDRPVIVRCSDDVPMEVHIPGKSAYGALPINDRTTPIPFETPLFKGVAMIRIADLPSSPMDYFGGKVRT